MPRGGINGREGVTARPRYGPLAAALVLLSHLAQAQSAVGAGSISGVLRDPAGAPVPNAAIVIVNRQLNVVRNAVSDAAGVFTVQSLPPADGYSLTIAATGFAEQEHVQLIVETGQDTNLNITLALSQQRTRVVVEDSVLVADQSHTGISQVVGGSSILNLPINGRRVDTYVLLTPAVAPDGVQGLVSFRGIAGGNVFLTDGNDTSNQFFSENAGRTRISAQISQDAVQEFQVLSTGYSAEYGRASGGIINTVTRSGSNQTSGTAYWFFRNRAMGARDPHSTVPPPPEQRHQAGASLGGKLVRDRLFYFFNGEIHHRDFPVISSLSRPPLFTPDGRFVGSCAATAQQCAAALAFLRRHFGTFGRTADSQLGFGKLDWRPTSHQLLSASFNYLGWKSPSGYQTQAVLNNGEALGANADSNVRTRYGRLAWTSIRGNALVNELRFGWFKDRHEDNLNPALIPAESGLAQITIEGQQNLGVLPEAPRLSPSENRFQLADNLSWTVGRHTWKAGFDLIRTEEYVNALRNQHGTYEYADFTSFARDFSGNALRDRRWQSYSQRFGNPVFDETIGDYGVYLQDQFRPKPWLSLNYGVRYEYIGLPSQKVVNPAFPNAGQLPDIRTNVAPRLGVSIGFNRSRTVVRAGYGLFYARFQGGVIGTIFLENGVYQRSIQLDRRFLSDLTSGPVFPNALAAPVLNTSAGRNLPTDLTLPSAGLRNGYTQHGDIGIEHALSSSLSANLSYVWSRGLRLTTVRDLNIGPVGAPAVYSITDVNGRETGQFSIPGYRLINRVNTAWRRINLIESGGNSYYNGLVLQLRKRMHNNFEGFATYTWSHAIDFNQGGGADNIFFNDGPRTLWNGDYRGEKASSQLDQRHRLVLTFSWESKARRRLLSAWRLSQISTLASAQPVTPTVLVSGVPFPGAAFNSTLNGFGGSPRVPFLPASSLDIDQVVRTDARLTRIVKLRERLNLHVNLEAFNLFNRVSQTAVNTLAYEARGGVLRPLPNLGEGVESQGYPDGTNARRAQLSVRLIW